MKRPQTVKRAALAGVSAIAGTTPFMMPAPTVRYAAPPPVKLSTATNPTSATTMGGTRLEIAPAGTFSQMRQIVAFYQSLSSGSASAPTSLMPATGTETHMSKPRIDWFDEASESLKDLAEDAAAEDVPAPGEAVIARSIDILRICSDLGAPDPSVEHDDKGGVDLFFKQNKRALLVAVRADGSLALFGDDPEEHWRGRYSRAGKNWKKHLTYSIDQLLSA
ncbi:hypothetical protein [Methylobacterium sp. A52T]